MRRLTGRTTTEAGVVSDKYVVVFDLDGVIIDTRAVICEALKVLTTAALDRPVDFTALDQRAALAPVEP